MRKGRGGRPLRDSGNGESYYYVNKYLLPTGSEGREVLGVGSIPVAILPSCQDMKTIAL